VQGVASSNPAAPTIVIKHLGQSSDWLFCFLGTKAEKVPNKFLGLSCAVQRPPEQLQTLFWKRNKLAEVMNQSPIWNQALSGKDRKKSEGWPALFTMKPYRQAIADILNQLDISTPVIIIRCSWVG
jgi:hypothetical protein